MSAPVVGLRFVDAAHRFATLPSALEGVVLAAAAPAGGSTDDPDDVTKPTAAELRAYRDAAGLLALLRAARLIKAHNEDGFADACAWAAGVLDDDGSAGDVADLLADFEQAAPTIDELAPDHAEESTAATILVTGTGFRPGATATIGGEPCAVTWLGPTKLLLVTPDDLAADDYDLVVSHPTGDGVTAADAFTADEA